MMHKRGFHFRSSRDECQPEWLSECKDCPEWITEIWYSKSESECASHAAIVNGPLLVPECGCGCASAFVQTYRGAFVHWLFIGRSSRAQLGKSGLAAPHETKETAEMIAK